MKTTRRGFLATIGLGAAAAALAPATTQAEKEQRVIEEIERSQYYEAIAQARADGYNRGREVEAARQESRQALSDAVMANMTASPVRDTNWVKMELRDA